MKNKIIDNKSERKNIDPVKLLKYTTSKEQHAFDALVPRHAIIYIIAGTKHIKCMGVNYTINAGDIFFIFKGDYLMSELLPDDGDFRSLMLFFDGKISRNLLSSIKDELPSFNSKEPKEREKIRVVPNVVELQHYFQVLSEYCDYTTPYLQELIQTKFSELFYLLLGMACKDDIISFFTEVSYSDRPGLSEVLEDNLYNSNSIDKLATLSGRSLSTFKREFYQLYGDTPKKWINSRRLEHATLLLRTTDKLIEEIAEDCGYISPSHFTRLFKQTYLTTPAEYKMNFLE